jgi:lipid-A-disaccharide synthase
MSNPISIYFALGEASGDALAADLVPWLAQGVGRGIELQGLAGSRLSALGATSLFNLEDIAVMGFTAVAARFPLIVRRVKQTVADILKKRPDCIVLVDSPDFTHAVARRVRKAWPEAKIVNYVCPSIWAWRPGRAKVMRAYVDHVLCLLPFEPDVLERLNGPPGTYVGHPLAATAPPLPIKDKTDGSLVVLPGSRSSEIERLMPIFGETIALLRARGDETPVVLPAVSRHRGLIEKLAGDWSEPVNIVDASLNANTFAKARAALACSGTVTLELALAGVPTSAAYKTDIVARRLEHFIVAWSAILPNLILDRPVVPEDIDSMAKPERLVRRVEQLLDDSPERAAQLTGFGNLHKMMQTTRPAGQAAARGVLDAIGA